MSTLLRCSADLFQAELYIWLLCTVGFKNAGFGKCGPGFIILGIPIPMQGLQQPRPGDTTTNSRGLWSGTKFTKIPSGNLVETGSHASEWISWLQFQGIRGETQWVIARPTLFNLSVDTVVHHWMSLTEEDESATHE